MIGMSMVDQLDFSQDMLTQDTMATFVFDGTNVSCYKDGQLIRSAAGYPLVSSSASFSIGYGYIQGAEYVYFDEIAYYHNRDLSALEVETMYDGYLLGYTPLDPYVAPEAPPASCDVHQLNILSQNTFGILNGTNYYVPNSNLNNIWVVFDRVINDTCDIEFSPDNQTWYTVPGEHYWDISEWCGITNMQFPEGTHYLRGHGYPNDGGAQLESCSYYFEPMCTPNWQCSDYSECLITPNNHLECQAVVDANNCGELFSGSLSTYNVDSCTVPKNGVNAVTAINNQKRATASPSNPIMNAIHTLLMNIRKFLGLN
jgi:hypothetical protein